MTITPALYRLAFKAACSVGRPVGGLRPRRMYQWLGRKGWQQPEFKWYTNRWKHRLYLSPHLHIDRYIISFGQYDSNIHYALESLIRPGMVCLDVGANLGEVSLHMASLVGANGRVYAYEPVPHVFERLSRHIEANHLARTIQPHQVAVSDCDGSAQIHYADTHWDNEGMGSLVRDDVLTQTCEVPTITLDSFAEQNRLISIDLIKIDVQGAEAMVLDGSQHTLLAFRPDLLIEISPVDLKFAGQDSHTLITKLRRLGYNVYEFRNQYIRRELTSVTPSYHALNVLCSTRRFTPGAVLTPRPG